MLRLSALILCVLAALTLDWNPAARTQSPSHVVESFSLITIHIDRSQRVALADLPTEAILP